MPVLTYQGQMRVVGIDLFYSLISYLKL